MRLNSRGIPFCSASNPLNRGFACGKDGWPPEFDTPRTKDVQQVLDLDTLLNKILAKAEKAR